MTLSPYVYLFLLALAILALVHGACRMGRKSDRDAAENMAQSFRKGER